MPTSKGVNAMWNGWTQKQTRRISVDWLKGEQVAEERILPSLDFNYIVRFSSFNLRKGTQYRLFTFDLYAERKNERWLIDVSVQAKKVLEVPIMVILKRMGITNFGAICIDKFYSHYLFKEAEIKEGQRTVTLQVSKNDYVWGNIKEIP